MDCRSSGPSGYGWPQRRHFWAGGYNGCADRAGRRPGRSPPCRRSRRSPIATFFMLNRSAALCTQNASFPACTLRNENKIFFLFGPNCIITLYFCVVATTLHPSLRPRSGGEEGAAKWLLGSSKHLCSGALAHCPIPIIGTSCSRI